MCILARRWTDLNNGDVLLRFQLADVVLELDDHFDQIHDAAVDLVLGAVQLSRGRRLKKAFLKQ